MAGKRPLLPVTAALALLLPVALDPITTYAAPKPSPPVNICLLVPDSGAFKGAGVDARRGAELAVAGANASGSRQFRLLVGADNDLWGGGTRAMVHLAFDEHAAGLIGGIDRRSAHLIEQVAVKSRVPFVALNGDDSTVTRAGVPWAFRIAKRGPIAISPQFVRRYRHRYGVKPGVMAALAYDATCLIVLAVNSGSGCQERQRAIACAHYHGVTGDIRFDRFGDRERR